MLDLNEYKNQIIAHRGVHNNKDIPENSMKAFAAALDYNLAIELDIHLTKDQKLIVFHDFNLERMTSINKLVEEENYSYIKTLDLLKTNEKIPLLEDVLNLVQGKVLLDIEIKAKKDYELLANLLLDELAKYNGPVIIKSFYPKALKVIKKKTNKYPLGLLLSTTTKDKKYNLLCKLGIIIPYTKPDFLAISKSMINRKNIQKYLNEYQVLIWAIENKEEILEIDNPNFIYVCNNLPFK